ncbi:hypothetical protein D3C71_943280 [compost metagenome]
MLAVVEPQRICGQIIQNFRNGAVIEGLTLDLARPGRFAAFGQELQGAHAVTANGGQEAVGVDSLGIDARGDPPADLLIVGQQVVEHGDDRRPEITILAKRQRKRHRDRVLPRQP